MPATIKTSPELKFLTARKIALDLDEISKNFLCVAWDTRGYGESDDYEGPLDFNDVLEDLKKVILFFKKDKAHILGLSMGGQIATLFYEKYPLSCGISQTIL